MITFFIFTIIFLIVSLLIFGYKFSKGLKIGKFLIFLHVFLVLINFSFLVNLIIISYRRTIFFIPGIIISLAGILIFVLAITKIKEGAIIPKKKLVKKGIYAYMKHPIYNGLAIAVFGAALFSGSLFVLIYFFVLAIMFFIVSKKEEEELSKRFGKEYKNYKLKRIL